MNETQQLYNVVINSFVFHVVLKQKHDTYIFLTIDQSHLFWPASFTLSTLARKACCDLSKLLHSFARLCELRMLEEGNSVATSSTTNKKMPKTLGFIYGSPSTLSSYMIKVTSRHKEYPHFHTICS